MGSKYYRGRWQSRKILVVDRKRFADGTLLNNIKKSPRLLVFSGLVLLACHIEPGIGYGIFDLPCDINLALLRIFPSQSSR